MIINLIDEDDVPFFDKQAPIFISDLFGFIMARLLLIFCKFKFNQISPM